MIDLKKSVTFYSYIKREVSYLPLLWMFSARVVNQKINRLHEKALTSLLNDIRRHIMACYRKVAILLFM